jgi:hypothetical protein
MYTVTSQYLSKEGLTADLTFDPVHHGDLSSAELISLLHRFKSATGTDLAAAELTVTSPGGSCTIRNLSGKLVVRSTRDGHARDLYFSPEDIVDHLDRSTTWSPFEPAVATVKPEPRGLPNRGSSSPILAASSFALGIGILLFAVHAATIQHPASPPVMVSRSLEPANDQAARLKNAVGKFATGPAPGDRVIVIGSDQSVRFYEIGPNGPADVVADSVTLGRHDTQACLATTANGVIDLTGTDSIVYSRDLYLRVP